jgi:hypothetical protein
VLGLQFSSDSGSSWSTIETTTIQTNGTYQFAGTTNDLGSSERFYVRYLNDSNGGNILNTNYLWGWWSFVITSYSPSASVAGGDFDIANIPFVSPASGITTTLPTTFQWTPRVATPLDSYEFDLYDSAYYTSPHLGYVSSYTLTSLPPGFSFGAEYAWVVLVYNPDGGCGVSFPAQLVTFE